MIGIDQSIHNEVEVVWYITKITAIRVIVLAGFFAFAQQAVVGPFPRETPLQVWIFVKGINILFDISRAYIFVSRNGQDGS